MCSLVEGADAGRLLVANVLIHGHPWRIVVVYAYNDSAQRENLFNQVRIHADTRFDVILLGDFNCVLYAKDRIPIKKIVDPSVAILQALVRDCDLLDTFTAKKCSSLYALPGIIACAFGPYLCVWFG